MYSEEFKKIVDIAISEKKEPYSSFFIGNGNANAKILIVGKKLPLKGKLFSR